MLEAFVLAGGLVPLAAMILVLFAVSRVRCAAAKAGE